MLPLLVVDPGLLGVDLVRVVVEVLPAEEEAELGVVPLLRLGHLLELGAVAGHELSQLVDDVPHLGVGRRRGRRRGARVHLFPEKRCLFGMEMLRLTDCSCFSSFASAVQLLNVLLLKQLRDLNYRNLELKP